MADSESDEEDFTESEEGDSKLAPPKPPRVPHRWKVTIAMALAFVLCNMDKVQPMSPPCKVCSWSSHIANLSNSKVL